AGRVSLQDGAMAELDERIGELLDALQTRGLLETSVLLVTSDHGEELFDHARVGHGGTLYDEVLRIPMIWRLPSGGGRVSDEVARTIDVFPTLLASARLPIPPGLEGRSLAMPSTPGSEIAEPVDLIAEVRQKRTYRVAARSAQWKYIRTYRAPRQAPDYQASSEPFGLHAGMRVRVRGRFPDQAQAEVVAEQVTVKDPADGASEITGSVRELDRENRRFRLMAFTV